MPHEIPAILRYEDLKSLINVSRSSLARWEMKSAFPKRIQIGDNSIGWRSDEVMQWLQERSNANKGD